MITTSWRCVPIAILVLFLFGDASADPAVPEPGQRVVLITGSTSGLGREVARALAEEGDHVIIHGRNAERGSKLVEEIMSGRKGSARFYRADFASLEEIRRLGEAILHDYDRLDVLVNNAGLWLGDTRPISADGHELHFQVNYLAGYVLTEMLTPLLERSAPSRVVNVSSIGQSRLDFDNLMLESNYDSGQAYKQSKLAQIMMTFYLADELSQRGISINALHPSTMMTTPDVLRVGRNATLGVINEDVGTGKYFNVRSEERAHDQAYEDEAVERLMEISHELTSESTAD